MYGVNNTIKVLIGKSINETTSPSVDPQSANFIADGEVTVLANNATTDEEECYPVYATGQPKYIRFAQNSGGRVHYSPRIKTANITKVSRKAYSAAVDQIDFVGFNATSGTIEELDNNEYMLNITYRHDDKMWSEQLNKRTYVHYSGDNTVAGNVAADFVKQINGDAYTAVKAWMVMDAGTQTVPGQNASVVNGSKTVVFAGNVTIATGSFFRIGGTTAATPVYKVAVGVTAGTTITLDTPYQGTTAAVVLNANMGVLTGITATGIKLTGLELDYVAKGIKPYNRVQFETTIVGFGTTTITNAQTVVFGTGLGKQVADLEWFALGGDGIRNFMWHPVPDGRTDANTAGTYYTYAVEYFNDDDQYVISGTKPSKGLVYIFFAYPLTATQQYDVFEAWMASIGL